MDEYDRRQGAAGEKPTQGASERLDDDRSHSTVMEARTICVLVEPNGTAHGNVLFRLLSEDNWLGLVPLTKWDVHSWRLMTLIVELMGRVIQTSNVQHLGEEHVINHFNEEYNDSSSRASELERGSG